MRHELMVEGHAFRLRPICDADAPFVLELRGNPALNRYLHPTSADLNDQLAWFSRYYERPGDYYFVVERLDSGTAEGLISLYDIDPGAACGVWGRWVLKPGSLAAVESAWLIYRCAFELLGLQRVCSQTIVENEAVVSFHDSCGASARRHLPGFFELNGQRLDAVEHEVTRETWSTMGPRLEHLVQLTARRLRRA